MRYEVGDTVKILPKFLLEEYDNWIRLTKIEYAANVVQGMYGYAGYVARITGAIDWSDYRKSDRYQIDLDGGQFLWEDIMFERTEPLFDGDPVPSFVSLREISMEGVDELI